MKYIFAFIEKVRLLASVLVLSLTYGRPAGEASREHCREAVPAVPALGGAAAVARHCVLHVAATVQV